MDDRRPAHEDDRHPDACVCGHEIEEHDTATTYESGDVLEQVGWCNAEGCVCDGFEEDTRTQ